jgi:CopG family nickel-responsive transcriptional regulator
LTELARMSVSLPAPLLRQLDEVVEKRGGGNRSQAVAEMIRHYVLDHGDWGEQQVMAGMITAFYANDHGWLRGRLQDIQHRYLKEVISSHHTFLEGDQSLEALLVQGPAERLRALADEMAACKGVHTVKLAITASLLPPLHGSMDE